MYPWSDVVADIVEGNRIDRAFASIDILFTFSIALILFILFFNIHKIIQHPFFNIRTKMDVEFKYCFLIIVSQLLRRIIFLIHKSESLKVAHKIPISASCISNSWW